MLTAPAVIVVEKESERTKRKLEPHYEHRKCKASRSTSARS